MKDEKAVVGSSLYFADDVELVAEEDVVVLVDGSAEEIQSWSSFQTQLSTGLLSSLSTLSRRHALAPEEPEEGR
ncbi:hypothetical protein Vadar_013833 [Vaccinium darrowii]|uniref:Uncharacterized protein n=1 Tax=Vaccinium darrowii TaxID=229202 RepID=A0ACB7X107_9ERIC|nr:hypothetical protein Vadar_013833 [Vaccinium darrowii]